MRSTFARTISFILCLTSTLLAEQAVDAQTGVSDDRVSVPDGPGSIEGLGDNATVAASMGMMVYAVPFELPRGFVEATPSLGLSYSSGSGSSIVGMGWTMRVPSIERLTLRGLPEYDADDELVADGGEQLVRVATSGGSATYRARFEGAFVRYTWHAPGAEGYFKAEYPDGSVGYFGATASGTIVPDARLRGADGRTFRYGLVERVDVHGHSVKYTYTSIDGAPYLTRIDYVFDTLGTPRYSVVLTYGTRPDPISDAKPTFEERITQRLTEVAIRVSGERIKRYVLTYESTTTSGGLSRLVRVQTLGRNGTIYPVVFDFGYSFPLGRCSGAGCERPRVVSMGTLTGAGAIRTGGATLVDLNGDALPDLVDTSMVGAHRIYRSRLDAQGRALFDTPATLSLAGTHSGFDVAQAHVQAIDLDADGLTDLANMFAQSALCNEGTGDWTLTGCAFGTGLGFTPEADPADPNDPNPLRTRFLDYDNDRRIDVLRTESGESTTVRRNTPAGFVSVSVDPIGLVFDAPTDRLSFADINGDGLLDPVTVSTEGAISKRLNLGFGRWSPWAPMTGPALTVAEADALTLEDLNGDGLDDLVIVLFDTVRYALNRAGAGFAEFETIDATKVDGTLGERTLTTTILYADMNGSGSTDIVWVQASGEVRYLELFPTPPSLLSRITNGIGSVQTVRYGTAVQERRADTATWTHTLPIPINVVTRLDSWTTLTGGENGAGLHELTTYRYRNGFYDGVEKQFRGFAYVEQSSPADAGHDDQEPGRTVSTFDMGATDVYRNGLALTSTTYSGEGAAERELLETRTTHADCTVAELPAQATLRFPVRYVCATEQTSIVKEGAPQAEWATTRTTSEYDGYGQVTRTANLGVVHMGAPESPVACGPCERPAGTFGAACGATCTGDEAFTETEFIAPGASTGGRWILGRLHTTRRYAVAGGLTSETRTFYDGPDFVGLAQGQLTNGKVTRVTARRDADSDATVALSRASYDVHGNVTVRLDPLGSAADDTVHRRSYGYDSTGLRVVRTEVHVRSPENVPYRLRREYSYDAAFDQVSEASGWMIFEGGMNRSARKQTSMRYDEFGRRIAIIRPGDSEVAPTVEYEWTLSSPASRIVERRRSVRGGSTDLERVICIDGRGRTYQERTRVEAERYQISGFAEFNSRGAPVRTYQPYARSGGACDTAPPTNVLYEDIRYDALAREIRRTHPDADAHASASTTQVLYAPLATATLDEEALDDASPHAHTPTLVHHDGLGRIVAVERRLNAGVSSAISRTSYDGLGRVAALEDAAGNAKTQRHDLLGRVLEIVDPNSGETLVTYDDAGNVVARTDARGITVRTAYDGANRSVTRWDDSDPTNTQIRIRYDSGGGCDPSDCTHAEGQAIEVTYPLPPEIVGALGGDTRGVDHFGFDMRTQATYGARTVASHVLITRRTFDDAGHVLTTTHPDGRTIGYTYDGAARIVGVDGIVENVDYDERGSLSRIDHVNGTSDTFAYDARTRLSHRTIETSLGDAIEDVEYVRDRVGTITRLTDAAAVPTSWRSLDVAFTHDAWTRLLSADFLESGAITETQTRSYDELDNARSVTSSAGAQSGVHVGDLAYDDARPNAVVQAGGVSYRYDQAGYMTGRGDLELTWDYLGRLTHATRGDQTVARFSYGTGMARVARVEGDAITLYASDDYEVRDGIGVLYVRLGRQRVARLESDVLATRFLGDPAPRDGGDGEVNAADAWAAHVEGAGVAAPGTLLRSAGRRLLAEAGDDRITLHSDHLGSLVAATDGNGNERGRRRFVFPSGEERASGFVDGYGFSGQETVESVGLVRFQYRWLDPKTHSWTRPDPLFESASASRNPWEALNRFAYAGHEYIDTTDPTGLTPRGTVVNKHPLRPLAAASPALISAGVFAETVGGLTRPTGAEFNVRGGFDFREEGAKASKAVADLMTPAEQVAMGAVALPSGRLSVDGMQSGHLLGSGFGAVGAEFNLTPLFEHVNRDIMGSLEKATMNVLRLADATDILHYEVEVFYPDAVSKIPNLIVITARITYHQGVDRAFEFNARFGNEPE